MKRTRKRGSRPDSQPSPLRESVKETQGIQLHLCHVCLYLNESSKPITKCHQCDHLLTFDLKPLDYLEKEEEWDLEEEALEVLSQASQAEIEAVEEEEELVALGRRRPNRITGLAVVW